MVGSSRPLGVWLSLWGVPLPTGGGAEDGSVVDRFFYGGIAAVGIYILSRRRINWSSILATNRIFLVFLAFMALSIVWSDYNWVSLKRYVKLIASVVMVLVILTDDRPYEAAYTVLRRCLYIHLPMSIICTRYFREIGVSFDWSGTAEAWQGIATSKNTLGQVAMIGVLYFTWEVWRNWKRLKWRNHHLFFLLLAAYLLKGSDEAVSKTSIIVGAFSLIVFFGIQRKRDNIPAARNFIRMAFVSTVALILLISTHSIVHFSDESVFGKVISLIGRDITLTGRTEIWSDVYDAASSSPIVGVGYGGFWIGRLANIPWNANMTWVLGQAHSGYVDTYLQLGIVGILIFSLIVFTTLRPLTESFHSNFDFAAFRITLFITILFVNITESTYLRGEHHLWLIFLLAIVMVPLPATGAVAYTGRPAIQRDYLRRGAKAKPKTY